MVLLPVLPPLEGESTVSWCCRLGPFHAGIEGPDWLRMLQISQRSVRETNDVCVNRLAELTGIAPERIRSTGVVRKGEWAYEHRGVPFGIRFALHTWTSYCPACLLEDTNPGSSSIGRRVGRISWMFSPVRTCPVHGILLTRRPNKSFTEQFQDMNRVAPSNKELEAEVSSATSRPISPLQEYVQRRFSGQQDSGWLHAQAIDQAVKACEMLGACLVFGAHTDLDKLSMAQWDEAGGVGFQAASVGPDGIRSALEEIAVASRKVKSGGGPQAAYGRLYQWLQFNKTRRELGPIREVVREHILDTMEVEPGAKLFGSVVEQRRRHSVASLARESGIHPKTLNRALVRQGIIPGGDEDRINPAVSFDAHAGETLAERINNSLPIKSIPDYLNCNRRQAEMLTRAGIVRQIVPRIGRSGGVLSNVPVAELDRFLREFRANGVPAQCPGSGMTDVISASQLARQPVVDIVRLVLDGELSHIELLAEDLRFKSVLVDPDEIRKVVATKERELGLTAEEVASRLGIFPSGVTHLRKTPDRDGKPFISATEIVNATGAVKYRFAVEEVDRFEAAHAALSTLAAERGVTSKAMAARLREAGISPIVRREYLNAAIYRRSDL